MSAAEIQPAPPAAREGRVVLAKNSIFNLVGQIVPMLIGVVTVPYIVKGLGENGYGILSIAYMVLGYFSIFDLGLSRATVKFVAENMASDKRHQIPELVWTSLSLLLALGIVSGGIAATFVPLAVSKYLNMPTVFVGEAKGALFILCASIPVMLGNDALRGVLEGTQRFDLVNYIKVPGSICFYLFAALAIPLGIRVRGVIVIMVMVRFVTGCAYLYVAGRVIPGLFRRIRFSRTSVRSLTVFGGWIMVSNLTGPIFSSIERFMIGSVLSVAALTYYSVPFDLVGKVAIFPASIAPAIFPYFSYHGRQGAKEISDVTSKSVKYLLFCMTPLVAVAVFFAEDILRLWLSPEFAAQSTAVMQYAGLLYFVNAFAYIPYTSVQAMGRPALKATLDLVMLPVYVAICWMLIPPFGINGAALAKLVVTVLDCGFLYFFAWKMNAFPLRQCISGPLFRAFACSGGLFALVYLTHLARATIIQSVFLVVACFALYLLAFWRLATDKGERQMFRSLSPFRGKLAGS